MLIQNAGIEIRIDGHLLAGHGIQGETGRHLRDPLAPLGDHHEVDDHQDHEHHQTDHIVAADHHFTEGLDDLAGGIVALVAMEQHDTGRGHVEGQAHQGRHQQHGREDREVQRTAGRYRDQQHQHSQHYVEREQGVQQPARQRQDHHGQDGQQHQRDGCVGLGQDTPVQNLPLRLT